MFHIYEIIELNTGRIEIAGMNWHKTLTVVWVSNFTVVGDSGSNGAIDIGGISIGIHKPFMVFVEFVEPVDEYRSRNKRFCLVIVI
mmetsp:Transcript_27815/g.65367  ORF Transcript_27815/g.65367 Transcript_27815/m.65367 type:complete len:86 (-) Transcript_27815:2939-3196(-)